MDFLQCIANAAAFCQMQFSAIYGKMRLFLPDSVLSSLWQNACAWSSLCYMTNCECFLPDSFLQYLAKCGYFYQRCSPCYMTKCRCCLPMEFHPVYGKTVLLSIKRGHSVMWQNAATFYQGRSFCYMAKCGYFIPKKSSPVYDKLWLLYTNGAISVMWQNVTDGVLSVIR